MDGRLVSCEHDSESSCIVITMDRPGKRNALSDQLIHELLDTVRAARDDDAVRSVIITGAGRAFCAGADLEQFHGRDHLTETGSASGARRELANMLEGMPKPSIAAINGHAMGGGLELALACTFRIVHPQAMLGLPEVGLGIMPGNGGTQRLARLVGLGRALEMILVGVPIEAQAALQIGLVNKVVSGDSLLTEAREWARAISAKSARAVAAAKEAILMSVDVPLSAGLLYENKWFAILCGSPEKATAVEQRLAALRSDGATPVT